VSNTCFQVLVAFVLKIPRLIGSRIELVLGGAMGVWEWGSLEQDYVFNRYVPFG